MSELVKDRADQQGQEEVPHLLQRHVHARDLNVGSIHTRLVDQFYTLSAG